MKVVAVSACPSGLMHTYLAAESLIKHAKQRGIDIKVETHGAIGVENRLTEEDIHSSDIIILMTDIAMDTTRFDHKKIMTVSTAYAIRHTDTLLDQIGDVCDEKQSL